MIQKIFEINKIDLKKHNLYLLYGENEGYKNEIIKNKFEKIYQNKTYRYNEKEVLEKKDEFFNSILSKSFFENEKLIIISRATDKIKDIVEEISQKKIDDIKIILISNILEKKSKLRNYFEKNKDAICIAFYGDNNQTLSKIALDFFRKEKISLSQQTLNLIVNRCKGDRENLNNELNKIDSFSKNKKNINSEDILKLTNLAENYNASELTDNCLAKNIKKIANILNENNYSNEDCILVIRTLLNKTKRLLKLKEEIRNNKTIDQAIANYKPPIFWKDKEIIKSQILNWLLKDVEKLIYKINNVELLVKKNSVNSLNIISDFLLSSAKKTNN